MKSFLVAIILTLSLMPAHAEYQQVNLTVFGMDCAPCAHAIHVSMKGIQGVDTVDVDLNTGLVAIKLNPGNSAAMRQFNQAVEKNGFTHKDADVVVRGMLSGTANAPILEVSGTSDRYALEQISCRCTGSNDRSCGLSLRKGHAEWISAPHSSRKFALTATASGANIAGLLGKTVVVAGVVPQAAKGKTSDTLRYKTITEAQ